MGEFYIRPYSTNSRFRSFPCLACQITFLILRGTSDSVIIEHTEKKTLAFLLHICIIKKSPKHTSQLWCTKPLPDRIYHIEHSKGTFRHLDPVVKRPSLKNSCKSIQFRLAPSLFMHFAIKHDRIWENITLVRSVSQWINYPSEYWRVHWIKALSLWSRKMLWYDPHHIELSRIR